MKKVAVINSDPDFRRLVKSFLERKGYAALTINIDEPVLPPLIELQPDVIVLDINAEKDAHVCEQIRRHEKVRRARLVILTEYHPDTLQCDADEVLIKPFAPEDLLEKIALLA